MINIEEQVNSESGKFSMSGCRNFGVHVSLDIWLGMFTKDRGIKSENHYTGGS